jgi:transposase
MKRINMRKIREVLRLKFSGAKCSDEKIARIVGIGETTVRQYLNRAKEAGITWPVPEYLCDKKLEESLYSRQFEQDSDKYDLPDFESIHKELLKKGVTLSLLWEEYKKSYVNYCCYSLFCRMYKEWCATGDTWMMQSHKAGDDTFIDWAGLTFPIYNPKDGEVDFEAQIFVSALGASTYIFCEGFRTQQIPDWALAHKHMSEFYEGVSDYWIPDNCKTAVSRSNRYEPGFQGAYDALARYYKVAILPARVRRPQDKSKVEAAVYLVENQILAPLRNLKFFSLEEFNLAVRPLLMDINKKPFQKMPGSSRYSLYLEIEKPALNPLPDVPYESFYYGRETLNNGYHIFIEGVPYSVPYTLVGKSIESRHNERTVEFFYNSKQIAIHQRSFQSGIPVTKKEHQPIKHQRHAESTDPENIKTQAAKMGDSVLKWVVHVLEDPDIKEKQRLNTALGVVRLSKTYSLARVNAACARGVFYNNFFFKGIEDILKRNLDNSPLPSIETLEPLPQQHANVRGSEYYL